MTDINNVLQLQIDELSCKKENELLEKYHTTTSGNETPQQAKQYIIDASDYFEELIEKYGFKITKDGLEYFVNFETGETNTITDEFDIVHVLSKLFCNDYYCDIHMPSVNNPIFSKGTEELNQSRSKRNVHGSDHVFGTAIFVAKMLEQLNFNPQLTTKDKIIAIVCAFMHDSCRKGDGRDLWDCDSAILATRILKHFGVNSDEDKQYLMEIMEYVGNKNAGVEIRDFLNNKEDDWKVEDVDNPDNEFKNKAKIIATLVDLGDTKEISRVGFCFDMDFFLNKIDKIGLSVNGYVNNKDAKQIEIVKSLARYHVFLAETKGIDIKNFVCKNPVFKQAYEEEIEKITKQRKISNTPMQKFGAIRSENIMQNMLRIAGKHIELLKESMFKYFFNLTPEEQLNLYLLAQMTSDAKTNIIKDTKSSQEDKQRSKRAIDKLRKEDMYLLIRGLGKKIEEDVDGNIIEILNKYIQENEEYKLNTDLTNINYKDLKNVIDDKKINNGIKDKDVVYIPHKMNINKTQYIVIETIFTDKFVDSENKIRHREFKIYKQDNDKKEINNLDDIKSLEVIDEQDMKHIISSISADIIAKEKEFHLRRLKRLDQFIEKEFTIETEKDEKLSDKIKQELEQCIEKIFNNDSDLKDRFKATQKLAYLLKRIKTLYKKDKKLTDHFIMLSNICRVASTKTFDEGKEEFQKELNYLYRLNISRTYNVERCLENPLVSFDGNFAVRGIEIDPESFTQESFKILDQLDIGDLEFGHGKRDYIDDYKYTKIGATLKRRNTTSYSTDTLQSLDYIKSDGVLFVCNISKERKEIMGMVDKGVNSNKEINTCRLEVQDVAFALKIKNEYVYDVVFNQDYNGEFYIKNKDGGKTEITEEDLKQEIIQLGKNTNELKNFLENQLVMEKLIEKDVAIDNQNLEVPIEFQNIMCNLIKEIDYDCYIDKTKRLNNLIELYYNNKDKQTELTEEQITKLINNKESYQEYLYNTYTNPVNIDKLLRYYKEFNGKQRQNIIKELEDYINNLINKSKKDDSKISTYLTQLIIIEPELEKFNIVINEDDIDIISEILFSCSNVNDFFNVLFKFNDYDKMLNEKTLDKILEKYCDNDFDTFVLIVGNNDVFIDYLFDNKMELIDKYISDNRDDYYNLMRLIYRLSLTKKGNYHLFKNDNAIISEFINKYKKLDIIVLVDILHETKEGRNFLFKDDGKLIDDFIEKNKNSPYCCLKLIDSLSNVLPEGERYLFAESKNKTKGIDKLISGINNCVNNCVENTLNTLMTMDSGMDYLFGSNGCFANLLVSTKYFQYDPYAIKSFISNKIFSYKNKTRIHFFKDYLLKYDGTIDIVDKLGVEYIVDILKTKQNNTFVFTPEEKTQIIKKSYETSIKNEHYNEEMFIDKFGGFIELNKNILGQWDREIEEKNKLLNKEYDKTVSGVVSCYKEESTNIKLKHESNTTSRVRLEQHKKEEQENNKLKETNDTLLKIDYKLNNETENENIITSQENELYSYQDGLF